MLKSCDPTRELILASTSPYRRTLLERLGVPFRCMPPGVDEERWKSTPVEPHVLAEQLAREKALSIQAQLPGAVVIGCDQLVACDGQILGKPGSVSAAVRQLAQLSGRCHELVTAVAIGCPERLWTHTEIARMTMHSLTPREIERYVEADLPLDCAGSYKLEQRGIALFSSIEARDHTAITGLPLIAVTTRLREIGFEIP